MSERTLEEIIEFQRESIMEWRGKCQQLERDLSAYNEKPTLRDQFAMAALPVILKYILDSDAEMMDETAEIAARAYLVADQMITERKK